MMAERIVRVQEHVDHLGQVAVLHLLESSFGCLGNVRRSLTASVTVNYVGGRIRLFARRKITRREHDRGLHLDGTTPECRQPWTLEFDALRAGVRPTIFFRNDPRKSQTRLAG